MKPFCSINAILFAGSFVVILSLSGCSRSESDRFSPYFVLQEEIHTVSQRTSKKGKLRPETIDSPAEAVAIFDANMDGLQDFVLVNGTDHFFIFLSFINEEGLIEFRGQKWLTGGEKAGKRSVSKGLGLHDFNNDGALDLHLCVLGKGTSRTAWNPSETGMNRQAGFSTQINDGKGVFTYHDYGVDGDGTQRTAVFDDFDGDGRFDCFISTSPYYGPWYSGSPVPCQLYPGKGENRNFGPNILNKVVVNAPANFWTDAEGNGRLNCKSAVIRDFDNDGQPDLAISAIADIRGDPDQEKSTSKDGSAFQGEWKRGLFLFRNVSQPGHIQFKDVSLSAITNAYGTTDQMHVKALTPADFNGDGRLDLIAGGMRNEMLANSLESSSPILRLYRNDSVPGKVKFTDVTEQAGLSFLNDPESGELERLLHEHHGMRLGYHPGFPVVAAIDIDNDADLDIIASVINLYNDSGKTETERIRRSAWVFINDGSGGFTTLSPEAHGLHVVAKDLSYGDLNNDGCQDLIMVHPDHSKETTGGNYVFINTCDNGNSYIKINITTKSDRIGIGAKVTVYETGTQNILGYDEVRTDFCYRSKKSTTLHFGLGKVKKVDVKVILRDGRTLTRRKLLVNLEHTLSIP